MADVHDRIRRDMVKLGHPQAAELTDEQIDQGGVALAKAVINAGVSARQVSELMIRISRGIPVR